ATTSPTTWDAYFMSLSESGGRCTRSRSRPNSASSTGPLSTTAAAPSATVTSPDLGMATARWASTAAATSSRSGITVRTTGPDATTASIGIAAGITTITIRITSDTDTTTTATTTTTTTTVIGKSERLFDPVSEVRDLARGTNVSGAARGRLLRTACLPD